MPNPFRKLSRQNLGGPIRSFIFLLLFYLYLWLEIEPRLIYHSSGATTNCPTFFLGWAFFREFIAYPGGLVEYLSSFLFQLFHYSWAGALIVTLLAGSICKCTDAFIKAVNSPSLRCLRFIPPILLLMLYSQYTYYFANIVAVSVAMIFVYLYLTITAKADLYRLAAFLVLSVILYTIAGGAYLLFAVLCAVYELFFRTNGRIGIAYLLAALVIPYLGGAFVFGVSIAEAFSNLLPFSWKILSYDLHKKLVLTIIYALCLFLPLTALALGLWRIFIKHLCLPARQHNTFNTFARIPSWYTGSAVLRWVTKSLILLVIGGAAVFFCRDRRIKASFAVDYYAYHRMWPQVLKAAVHYPKNYFVMHLVNRALYHTGRLGYDMFAYTQHHDALFVTAKNTQAAYWKRFDTYIDLGLINMAEKSLSETLEQVGERPIILKRLAMVHMVKGNIDIARIYLRALGKTLFHAGWADDYLSRLEADPELSTDERIQRLRRIMMKKDYNFIAYKTESTVSEFEGLLLDLLDKNRRNRMAFEYLMASYLLTKQLDKFVQNLDRLDDFNYPQIPRHYEEAILIYETLQNKKVDLKGRRLSLQSRQRLKSFINILQRYYVINKQSAFDKLAEDYGDSYFFYHLIEVPGISK